MNFVLKTRVLVLVFLLLVLPPEVWGPAGLSRARAACGALEPMLGSGASASLALSAEDSLCMDLKMHFSEAQFH